MSPLADDALELLEGPELAATVQSVNVNRRQVEWSVIGAGASCDPGLAPLEWVTEYVTLRVRYKLPVRVLTLRTAINRGDRICRKYGRRIAPIVRRVERLSDPDLDVMERALRDMAMWLRGMNRSLGKLAVPAERRSSFRKMRSALDRAQYRTDAAADAIDALNAGAIEFQTRKLGYAIDDATRHARRYGFKSCGGG